MRQMADPTAWHIMPSRRSSRVRKRPATGTSHASFSTQATAATGVTMGPPPDRKRKRQPVVLDEDEYEAAMTEIIRRDFFPDNRRLANQLEVR